MKKILFLSLMLIFGSVAYATPDVVLPKEYSGSQQITSKPTTVGSINVAYIGATAGDFIQLQDSIGPSSLFTRFTCVASTSSGTCQAPYSQSAAYFGTGVYLSESHGGNSGIFKTDIQSY